MPAINKSFISRLPFHYGWLIAFAGMLSIFACLGFARFALGMILPSMSESLRLSYADMGLLGTGNFLGYLISVLATGRIILRFGSRTVICSGLLLSALSMFLISFSDNLALLICLYFITGIGSGITNVAVMGLVASWFERVKRGTASGFIVIGSGFAILSAGFIIPQINNSFGSEGWRISWAVSSVVIFLVTAVVYIIIRNKPEDAGLRVVGFQAEDDGALHDSADLQSGNYLRGVIFHLGLLYFFFGFTYVIYITFIVTALVRDYGFTESAAGQFWAWVGFLSLFSGPIFGTLTDRIGRKQGLMIVFLIQATAYMLAATGSNGLPLYLSILCFGITAWSIPSIMAAAVGDYFGSLRAPSAFGFITFIFGIGQITGPIAAGAMAEITGGFSSSFMTASIVAGIAVIVAALLKKPEGICIS